MKKVIRLTESDLTRIVKRVINEQSQGDIFMKKGFEIFQPKDKKINDVILRLKNKFAFGETKVYNRKRDRVMLISDGKQVFFLSAPNGFTVTQVYKIEDVQNKI